MIDFLLSIAKEDRRDRSPRAKQSAKMIFTDICCFLLIVIQWTFHKTYILTVFECTVCGIKYSHIMQPSPPSSPEIFHLPQTMSPLNTPS